MKDTIITASRKRKEIIVLALSFAFAFLMNVYAVIIYKQPAIELFTQIHVVLLISLFIYAVATILRILWWLLAKFYKSIVKS
jgi:hypothetical protein